MWLLLQIINVLLLTQRRSASVAHQMLTMCDEVQLSFAKRPVLFKFPFEGMCVCAAEQIHFPAAYWLMLHRKLSKEAQGLLVAELIASHKAKSLF